MIKIKFSVTIPAYKAQYLHEAIESVLKQTYNDFELIVVDDSSPEDLKKIVSFFSDERLFYYRNEKNCGAKDVVDNWNICLSKCTGDFVICMGDDDMLSPNALEEYAKVIDAYPYVDVVHARTYRINEIGKPIAITPKRPELENVYEFMLQRFLGCSQFIGDFCYRTSVLKAAGGFYKLPMAWGSDDITAVRAASTHGIANVITPTFLYRTSRFTISKSINAQPKLEAISREYEWYKAFFNNKSTNDLQEQLTKNEVVQRLNKFIIMKQLPLLHAEIRNNPFNIIKWMFKAKAYNISIKTIIKSAF